MKEIIFYIFKKYGILLSEEEARDFIDWFKLNEETFIDEDTIDTEATRYLYAKYKGRPMCVNAEDLSSMKYLLTLLKNETKGK